MKKILLALMLVCGVAYGDTTPNLLNSGSTTSWSNTTLGSNGGTSGGPTPAYNTSTDTIIFSYSPQTVSQIIGINTALQGTGIQVNGYNYSWLIHNNDNNIGNIVGNVNLKDTAGNVLRTYTYDYSGIRTSGLNENFQQFTGTETFTNPYLATNLSTLTLSFTGNDNKYWAGYYGPRVRAPSLSLNYTVDQCSVNPQSSPTCPGYKTFYNIGDDGWAQVDLPFAFPFYGRNFTTSYMFSNGVVGFLDPNTNQFCCDGVNLNNNPGPSWNYAIYALQTDLIAANPNAKFYTQSDSSYMKYTWENINEYGTQNLNTFSTTIRPTGFIGLDYQNVNIQNHSVTIGIAGDISIGQYSQYYNGQGSLLQQPSRTISFTGTEITDQCILNPLYSTTCPLYTEAMCASNPLFSTSCSGYATAYFSQQCSINQLYDVNCPGYASAYLDYQCSLDPLYSTTCQGYEQAYYNQQCSINPLYDSGCTGYAEAHFRQQCSANPLYATTCSGYAVAYHDQQCAINPLYATDCRGYQTAYYNQQCSLNPLYDIGCTGYAQAYKAQQCSLNALYATDCPGYEVAYFNQQCSLNSLYNSQCPGYAQAYFNQQCSLNPLYNSACTGYTQAYHDQQCSLNALYATDCPGYAVAYKTQQCTLSALYATDCPGYAEAYLQQQCSINPLYSTKCSGYAVAYFNQQCSLSALYDKTCPGYAEAYALKYIVVTKPIATQTTATTISTTETASPTTVAMVSDPVVNKAITTTTTSASPANAATATVPLVSTQTTTATVTATVSSSSTEEKKDATGSSISSITTASSSSTETKADAKPTARQELQQKRVEAARAKAVEQGKNLGSAMGNATSIEAQKQLQNIVIAAMGFTPGFDAYGKVFVPDAINYKPFTVYNNQVNVDNKRLGMGLYGPSDRLHNDLVESQFKGN
jgi:hypothetical protein